MTSITRTVKALADLQSAISWVSENATKGLKGGTVVIMLGRETRSTDQNSKLWPMLTDISKQVEWYDIKHSPEVWKDLITGTLRKCLILPNLDGTGFVMCGLSTRKMSKANFCELIEYIYAFGAEKNVIWSEKSLEIYAGYREAAI